MEVIGHFERVTRFVAHKVAALNRVIDRYGAYLSHTMALTENPKVKSVDKQKLKGYIKQWQDFKMLLGCAAFHDILKPCAILCKVLQEDEACVVRAIESILRTKKSIYNLKSIPFHNLPTVKKVLNRIQHDDGSVTYQEAEVTNYQSGLAYLESHQEEYMDAVQQCLKNRIRVQNLDILTHSLVILATNGWEKSEDPSFAYEALDSIAIRFQVPSEKAQLDCSQLQEEWNVIVDYAKRYLNIVKEGYTVIWWKLFNLVDSK